MVNIQIKSLLLISGLFCASHVHAEFIIDVQDAEVRSNSVGTIDVLIGSTDTDQLASFNVRFLIEQIGGGGVLQFQASPNDLTVDANLRQQNSEQQVNDGSIAYVFHGNSSTNNFTSQRSDLSVLELVQADTTADFGAVTVGTTPFCCWRDWNFNMFRRLSKQDCIESH